MSDAACDPDNQEVDKTSSNEGDPALEAVDVSDHSQDDQNPSDSESKQETTSRVGPVGSNLYRGTNFLQVWDEPKLSDVTQGRESSRSCFSLLL